MANLKEKRAADIMILAVVRTDLANRRTLLAYIRAATGIGIASIALIHFVENSPISNAFGFVLIPVAGIVLIVGIADYFVTKRKIKQEKEDAEV